MKKFENFVLNILQNDSKKRLVLMLTALAFFLSLLMFPAKLVLAKMLPGKSDNTISVYVDTPSGSSIEQTNNVSQCVINEFKREKEVQNIELFLGQGIPLDYAGLVKGSGMKQSENVSEISINLSDKNDRDEPTFLMTQRVRPLVIKACGGIVKNTSIKFIEQPAGPPTMASIVVEVHGDDVNKIRTISNEVVGVLANTKGLVDVDTVGDKVYEKYLLVPNKDLVAQSGITMEQVNNILYLAFEGMIVGSKNNSDYTDQIPIFLSLDKDSKNLNSSDESEVMSRLSSLNLMSQSGATISMSEVVDIKRVPSNPMVMHKDLSRMINVVAETDMVSQVYPLLDAREKMIDYFSKKYTVTKEAGINTYMFDLHLKDKKTGEEFLLRWDGEMKVTLDTFRDLGGAFISALVLIFLLLVVYYKSFVLSGIVLLGSFLSLIGVIVGHFVADLVTRDTFFLTATSLIGFIALMGISSRNSLLLIDFAKSLMVCNSMSKKEAIAVAAATRAKPIILTAVAIILGSALLASDPIFGGLGVALISGTVAAVFVSLLFVPILMDNAKAMDFEQKACDTHENISITK
jgi:multidrug efflux pump subunit AcrB